MAQLWKNKIQTLKTNPKRRDGFHFWKERKNRINTHMFYFKHLYRFCLIYPWDGNMMSIFAMRIVPCLHVAAWTPCSIFLEITLAYPAIAPSALVDECLGCRCKIIAVFLAGDYHLYHNLILESQKIFDREKLLQIQSWKYISHHYSKKDFKNVVQMQNVPILFYLNMSHT